MLKTALLKTKIINYTTNHVYSAELTPRSSLQAECLIGRHPGCDLVLDGPAVSRVHGRFLFDSQQCFFVDLGSTDGSRLNNEEMKVNQSYAIAPDDVIRIGEFALVVEDLAPTPQISRLQNIWAGQEITGRCVQIIQETHDVKTFRFVSEPELLFAFKPGQFATLKLPINQGSNQPPLLRSYSISSSPSRPHTLDITVKRVGAASEDLPPGVASNWLHDHLKVGMTLAMQGPFGDFNCVDHPADKLLLISAGSGITPMMSMAQWLSDLAANTEITFIHAARTPQDIIFRQRLALLAAQHPQFKLAFTLTQQSLASPWAGYRGRLNRAMLTAICPDFTERNVFVCGSSGFMDSTQRLLKAEGFPMENYFEESFGGGKPPKSKRPKQPKSGSQTAVPALPRAHSSPKAPATVAASGISAAASTAAALVEFSVSGKSIACDDTDTLLDAAEQAGVTIPSGCRMGSCGACKQPITAGEVCYDREPRGLSAGDRAANHVLACVAKPIGKVIMEL